MSDYTDLLSKLIQPPEHTCPSCNKKFYGDIPFKTHLENCPAVAKNPGKIHIDYKSKPKSAPELVRILKEKV